MSTLLSRGEVGRHDITVDRTASELERVTHGRFTHPVDWPHLWRAGDLVAIVTSDGLRYVGMALDVSGLTSSVLIEIDRP